MQEGGLEERGNGLNTEDGCQISQQGYWSESGVNFQAVGTTVDMAGRFGRGNCVDPRSIACCAPVP